MTKSTKLEKVVSLISRKDKQLVLTLNYELVTLLKKAAKAQDTKITHLFETWAIKYLDDNGYLDNH